MNYEKFITDEMTEKVLSVYQNTNQTYGEIGKALNIPREAVRTIIVRKVRALNKIFKTEN